MNINPKETAPSRNRKNTEMPFPKMQFNQAESLRNEIRETLPYGQDWLTTPHQLLGGVAPEERILAGDLEAVRNLFHSILYVGVM